MFPGTNVSVMRLDFQVPNPDEYGYEIPGDPIID